MPEIERVFCADTLFAIVIAARRAGDRDLEKRSRRELESRHGVKLSFQGRGCSSSARGKGNDS